MKKTILSLLIVFSFISLVAQDIAVRTYPSTKYTVKLNGETETTYEDIKIIWNYNDATTLDNVDIVLYPSGYVKVKTYPKHTMTTKDGDYVYESSALDEKNRKVIVSFLKITMSKIIIMVYYSERLHYLMSVELNNYVTTYIPRDKSGQPKD